MGAAAIPFAVASAAFSMGQGIMGFFGQQQQAQAAEAMGRYNYETQKRQMEMQATMAAQQAEAQAAISGRNAQVASNEALRAEQEARERARRIREDNRRLLGAQNASFGRAGVAMEGTPLQVMADTAAMGELMASDAMYEGDAKRGSLLAEAEIHRYSQQFSLLQTGAHNWSRANASAFAMPHLMAGRNQASAGRTASWGSLLSGASGAAMTTAAAIR